MSNIILKAEDLRKSYGDLEIIKGLNIEIREAEKVSIVGKSGSGKSTLLNLLALLDKKDGGKIYYSDKDTDTFKEREIVDLRRNKIAFVFQNSLLFEDFSAYENIMLSLTISGFSNKEAKERAERVLEAVGLKERMHHRPKELSGGERQRTALCRAIAGDARLIFLDEPTGSLDEEAKESVENLMLCSPLLSNRAMVIVTHDLDLAKEADSSYLLKGGVLEKL